MSHYRGTAGMSHYRGAAGMSHYRGAAGMSHYQGAAGMCSWEDACVWTQGARARVCSRTADTQGAGYYLLNIIRESG